MPSTHKSLSSDGQAKNIMLLYAGLYMAPLAYPYLDMLTLSVLLWAVCLARPAPRLAPRAPEASLLGPHNVAPPPTPPIPRKAEEGTPALRGARTLPPPRCPRRPPPTAHRPPPTARRRLAGGVSDARGAALPRGSRAAHGRPAHAGRLARPAPRAPLRGCCCPARAHAPADRAAAAGRRRSRGSCGSRRVRPSTSGRLPPVPPRVGRESVESALSDHLAPPGGRRPPPPPPSY